MTLLPSLKSKKFQKSIKMNFDKPLPFWGSKNKGYGDVFMLTQIMNLASASLTYLFDDAGTDIDPNKCVCSLSSLRFVFK